MIKILKLVTGEEVLGKVEDSVTQLKFSNPCVLQLVPSRSNPDQIGMALLPYASYAKDQTIFIDKGSVVWEQEPVDELRNQYNSIFGNGIVLAKSLVK